MNEAPTLIWICAAFPDSAEDTIAGVTQGTLTLDPNMQYQFRADTSQGQVTYRVVQVATDGSQGEAQVVTTNAFPAQVAQVTPHLAVIKTNGCPVASG